MSSPFQPSPPVPAPAADPADDWSTEVLTGTVLPTVLEGAVPQPHPVVVYVLGQPGSGKTTIIDHVHAAGAPTWPGSPHGSS